MKRKFVGAVLLCWAVSSGLRAQTDVNEAVVESTDKYKVETNGFWSNWFITAGGGAQMYFGDHDRQVSFGDRLSPALDIAVGKWFTPGIGVRLMYSGLSMNGATQTGVHSNDKPISGKPWQGYWLEEQSFDFFHLHGDVLFNVSNLLCGYNESRVWNITPYVGVGWMRVWDRPSSNELGGSFGILNSFRISSALDVNLDVRGTGVSDAFDGETGGKGKDGLLSATVGLTYKLPQRGWNRSKTIVKYDNEALNEMRGQLDALRAENARLQRAIAEGNKAEIETILKKMLVAAPNLCIFKIGKSDLLPDSRVNLDFFAKVIKACSTEAVYTITGYADKGTGTPDVNERLSRERADAVYGYLVDKCGVPASQLRKDYKGGVDNMFYDDPKLSRAVITQNDK